MSIIDWAVLCYVCSMLFGSHSRTQSATSYQERVHPIYWWKWEEKWVSAYTIQNSLIMNNITNQFCFKMNISPQDQYYWVGLRVFATNMKQILSSICLSSFYLTSWVTAEPPPDWAKNALVQLNHFVIALLTKRHNSRTMCVGTLPTVWMCLPLLR
jgi:hypothetical protein